MTSELSLTASGAALMVIHFVLPRLHVLQDADFPVAVLLPCVGAFGSGVMLAGITRPLTAAAFGRGTAASVVIALVLAALDRYLCGLLLPDSQWWRLVRLALLAGLGVAAFGAMAMLLRLPGVEFIRELVSSVWSRVKPAKPHRGVSA